MRPRPEPKHSPSVNQLSHPGIPSFYCFFNQTPYKAFELRLAHGITAPFYPQQKKTVIDF